MSLVSSFVANVQWGLRASEYEMEWSVISDRLAAVVDKISNNSDLMQLANTNFTTEQGKQQVMQLRMMQLHNRSVNGTISGDKTSVTDPATGNKNKVELPSEQDQLNNMIAEYIYSQQRINEANNAKTYLELEKNKLHREEQGLQAKLKGIEAKKKLADANEETAKGMQEGAIKRLSIKM